MNKRDRKIVDYAREAPSSLLMQDLLVIIDRLDKQITEIRGEGEPIEDFIRYFPKEADEYVVAEHFMAESEGDRGKLRLGQLRRLDEALKEEKD